MLRYNYAEDSIPPSYYSSKQCSNHEREIQICENLLTKIYFLSETFLNNEYSDVDYLDKNGIFTDYFKGHYTASRYPYVVNKYLSEFLKKYKERIKYLNSPIEVKDNFEHALMERYRTILRAQYSGMQFIYDMVDSTYQKKDLHKLIKNVKLFLEEEYEDLFCV